ncbi:MAG TPA: penicillin-binding protein 2, partial [Actinomycetota bacterium]|nr:penicillin-binding protein 2 [Actinomycetota bacterium]
RPRPHRAPGRPRAGAGDRPPANRLVAVLVAMVVGLLGVVARLGVLQVRDASSYRRLAVEQRLRTLTLPATRGAIFDRNGEELALSLPAKAVFVDPQLVRDPEGESVVVARALGLPREEVYRAMTAPGRFVYLARQVDLATARRLERRRLPGVGFLDESRRHYPAGPLAPQVLGFVGVDGVGLAGLELQYDRVLSGEPGRQVLEVDPGGRFIPQGAHREVPPTPGEGILTTIDRDIQYAAQRALARAVRENRARGGSVIVMVPSTGEVLAMASYPWFDPERFEEAPPARQRNRAVTDAYEPGSVNKLVTVAAAIEEGVVKINQRLMVPDHYPMYSKVFRDVYPHPTRPMTVADIIAHSSNVGAIMLAERLGKERLSRYLSRFGLGRPTGVDFPGESPGIVPDPSEWSGTSMGTIPIGQGIAVTPLQMAAAYAAVANDGVWVQPRLVRAMVGRDGGLRPLPPPRTRQVVSERTARWLRRILAFAVEEGTGQRAQVPGYWVAGKTGTAKKPLPDGRGYGDRFVASFIGFAPAARPAVLVAAVLDEPVTVYGGVAAAPLFREVARFALARLRVPPAPRPPDPPHAVPVG